MADDDLKEEWLTGHRIGQAAALCLSGDPALLADGTLFRADELVADSLQRMGSLDGLPLATLNNLKRWAILEFGDARRAPDVVTERAGEIEKCIASLTEASKETTPGQCAIGLAQCAVYVVFRTNWGAESLRRLFIGRASKWYGYGYGRDQWGQFENRFGEHLSVLRSPWTGGHDTETRVQTAIELSGMLDRQSPLGLDLKAKHFTFELMDRLVAWPLLVMQHEGAAWTEFGTSMPLKVDLKPTDGATELRFINSADAPTIDHQPWNASAHRVIAEAIRQYVAAGGKRSAVARGMLVEVDFCWADRIMRSLCNRVTLVGRSFEAYLATVVLSRLLEFPASPATLITGEIENSQLAWPEGTEHKIRYIFDSAVADRIIVPRGFGDRVASLLSVERERQIASVLQVGTLDTAMVATLGQAAARTKLVRCPEGALRRLTPLATHSRAHSIEATLFGSDQLCVDLSLHADTRDVCADDLAFAIRGHHARSPPSTLFVRVHEDEDDDAVWELLGESLAWGESNIDSVIRAGSPSRLADRLLELLGGKSARLSVAYIVLVGGSDVAAAYRDNVDPTRRPHCLAAVLHQLSAKAVDSRVQLPCRFVLTPGAWRFREPPGVPLPSPWLDRLRIFRGGFDLRCAASVLRDLQLPHEELRRSLKEAVAAGWLVSLSDGDFLFDTDPPASEGGPALLRVMADEEYAAEALLGPAFAPSLRRVGLCQDEAFSVHNVLEASYHLNRSVRLAHIAGDPSNHKANALQSKLFFAQRYLRRRSLSSLANKVLLWRAPELVISWVKDEGKRLKEAGCALHPLLETWDGRVAFNYLWRSNDFSQLESRLQDMFVMYRQGLAAAGAVEQAGQREFVRLSIASRIEVMVTSIESALQFVCNPHECSLSGVNLAALIPRV